jgi:hypothetical protein
MLHTVTTARAVEEEDTFSQVRVRDAGCTVPAERTFVIIYIYTYIDYLLEFTAELVVLAVVVEGPDLGHLGHQVRRVEGVDHAVLFRFQGLV